MRQQVSNVMFERCADAHGTSLPEEAKTSTTRSRTPPLEEARDSPTVRSQHLLSVAREKVNLLGTHVQTRLLQKALDEMSALEEVDVVRERGLLDRHELQEGSRREWLHGERLNDDAPGLVIQKRDGAWDVREVRACHVILPSLLG